MEVFWTIMTWPLVACLLLPPILVYFGLHVVRRGVIFVDLALAQMATLGTSLCIMLGHDADEPHTYWWSVGFTLVGAAIFTLTRTKRHQRVPQEALIGIVYVVAAAAGILFLSRSAEGNEELKKTLIGDVLTVTSREVWVSFTIFALIGVVHYLFRKKFVGISFEPERAEREGWPIRWWDFLFYALFGLVVVRFVHVGGVLLVFSYLIVPAVCANLLSEKFGMMLVIGWLVAMLGGAGGLGLSYRLDLPTGAAIVCMLGAILVVALIISAVRECRASSRADT